MGCMCMCKGLRCVMDRPPALHRGGSARELVGQAYREEESRVPLDVRGER